MFIATNDLAGPDIDVRQAISWHLTKTACTVEAGIDNRDAIAIGANRWRHRNSTMRRTTAVGVRFGL